MSSEDGSGAQGRPYLGVQFDCCGTYARVYRDRDGKQYSGRCPKCLRPVRFQVGAEGSAQRFWRVR
jgi:hypothetical protein